MRRTKTLNRNESFWAYVFVALPILQILIFLSFPLVYSLRLSFMDWDLLTPARSVGFQNFKRLLADEKSWISLGNTFYLMLGMPIRLGLAFFLALLLNREIGGRTFYKVMYFIPAIVSVVAASQMFLWFFNSNNGIVNTLIKMISGVKGPSWFSDPKFIKIPMITMNIWGGLGPTIIFYLAALQNIPDELMEAADLDGAGWWTKVKSIIIPKVTPITFFLVTIGMIGALQNMAQSYVMAGPSIGAGAPALGGPQYAAATVVFHLWNEAFHYFNMGYASAIAWGLAILVFIITAINLRSARWWVNYD